MPKSALDVAFQLPPQKGKLLRLLLTNKMLAPNEVKEKLDTDTPAHVIIKSLKEHMQKWEPIIRSKRRVGYWIDETEKQRLVTLAKELLHAGDNHTP